VSRPQDHSAVANIESSGESSDLIGNRTVGTVKGTALAVGGGATLSRAGATIYGSGVVRWSGCAVKGW
jgi:hypothetical protein